MRFEAKIKVANVIFLVDSGSTHNFLDSRLVFRLSLPVGQQQMRVTVADGRHLFTTGVCKEIEWEVQGFSFIADFIVLPLKGCDVVPGIQWLLSLGSINWNFGSMTMQFTSKVTLFIIRGISLGNIEMLSQGQSAKCFS